MKKTYFIIAIIALIVIIAIVVTILSVSHQKNKEIRLQFERMSGITLPANAHIAKNAKIERGYVYSYAYSVTMDYEAYQAVDHALRHESYFFERFIRDFEQPYVDELIRENFPLQLGWVQSGEKEFVSGFTTRSPGYDGAKSSFVVVLFLKSKTSDTYELIIEW